MVCYRTDDQVRSYNKSCDCWKRIQKVKPKSDKTGENMATPKKLYPVEGGIDLSSCRLCESRGLKILQKLVQRSQSWYFGFRATSLSCLNWSVVLVKEMLKTQQLLRKQSLKRNGYSWRKKAERREEPRKRFRENESNIRSLCASSSLSEVSVFIVILFYISTAALQLFREMYLPIWARYIWESACSVFTYRTIVSYEIYTLLSYLTKAVYWTTF